MQRFLILVSLFLTFSSSYADECIFNVISPNFGNYQPFSSNNMTALGEITSSGVTCAGVAYTVKLSAGNSGTYTKRRMTVPNDYLEYNLYVDPDRTTIFGDGTNNSIAQSSVNNSVKIYGLLPGLQMVSPGAYNDNITVYITY